MTDHLIVFHLILIYSNPLTVIIVLRKRLAMLDLQFSTLLQHCKYLLGIYAHLSSTIRQMKSKMVRGCFQTM